MNHYETLGVGKEASNDQVKRAYRKKASKTHPDKGGNADDFKAIQRAYETLSDPHRRAHYDATGEEQPQQSVHEMALSNVGNLFMQIIDQVDADHTNVVSEMQGCVKKQIAVEQATIQKLRSAISKREGAIKRLRKRGAGANILEQMLHADIAGKLRVIDGTEDKIKVFDAMLEIIGEYEYRADIARVRGGATFAHIAEWR